MKKLLALAIVLGTLPAVAESDPAGPPPPPPGQEMRHPGKPPRDFMKGLNPEERERFEAARKKALEDPAIKALRDKAESANREFFEAMKAKMNEIDPGLAEILKNKAGDKFRDGKHGGDERGLASLSESERQRLMAAREIAKTSPAVQAAEEKRKAATTPEEKMAAAKAFHEAMKSAILAADPSLAGVLEKIKPDQPKKGGPRPGPDSGGPGEPPMAPGA